MAIQTALDSISQNAGSPFGFKNRIINGGMVIDQRNAGASVTPTTGQYLIDRWRAQLSQSSKFTVQQNAGSVTPPSGFAKYLGVTSSSAYSIQTGDYFGVNQFVEAYNMADLDWGLTTAKPITLSFWVRSSLTGTFSGAIRTGDNSNYSYPFTYTISSANTWEYKTITISGPTSGTWGTGNSTGLDVWFSLGTGSTYSGTANTWAAANYVNATGSVNLVATNAATWYVTGVQFERGTQATNFDWRPYGTELQLCQRYYYRITPAVVTDRYGWGWASTTTTFENHVRFPVSMRIAPSALEQSGTASDYAVYSPNTNIACSAVPTFIHATNELSDARFTVSSGLTQGFGGSGRCNTSTVVGYLGWSAEL